MKDKNLRNMLFGINPEIPNDIVEHRRTDIVYPIRESGDIERKIQYPSSDGLVLYFIKRIEQLESKVEFLQANLKAKK